MMSIEETIERRALLEFEISKIVDLFNKDTGLIITNINIDYVDITMINDTLRKRIIRGVEIQAELPESIK